MKKYVAALTGAGISAESGIPTFRGQDGYWTVGSQNYRPQELATRRAFAAMPRDIWDWYLSRLHACRSARPNAGHQALSRLAQALGPDRFSLITQNVDGLHGRSGVEPACLFEIHGNIRYMRCFTDCGESLQLLPKGLAEGSPAAVSDAEWETLHCSQCGGLMRPHVLWFDEYYEERYYRSDSAMAALQRSDLLLVVGTSGATTLPAMIMDHALRIGMGIIEVNLERSVFTTAIEASSGGQFVQQPAARALPVLVDGLLADPGDRLA